MEKKETFKFGAKMAGAQCVSMVIVKACKVLTGYGNVKPLTKMCLWIGSEILGWVIGDICVDKLENEVIEMKEVVDKVKEEWNVGEATVS